MQRGQAMLPEKSIFFIYLRLISLWSVYVTMLAEIVALFIEIVEIVCELKLSAETIGLSKCFVFLQRHPNCFLNLVITNLQVFQLIRCNSHQTGKIVVIWSIDIWRELAKPKNLRKLGLNAYLLKDLSLRALLYAFTKVSSSSWNSEPTFELALFKLIFTLFYSISRIFLSWISTPPHPTWNIE